MHEWAHIFSTEWFQVSGLAQTLPPFSLDLENWLQNKELDKAQEKNLTPVAECHVL